MKNVKDNAARGMLCLGDEICHCDAEGTKVDEIGTNASQTSHLAPRHSRQKLMQNSCKHSAFTLAEMMVVLLIMSIVLACLAPAMTTKMKADQSVQSSPWKWANNNIDAYYSAGGGGNNQVAMIGQNTRADADSAKLIINNSSLTDMILFKNGNDVLGRLQFSNGGMLLGTFSQGAILNDNSIAIGNSTNSGAEGTIAIGSGASVSDVAGVAIGSSASATTGATSLGERAKANGDYSIAIGSEAKGSAEGTIAIGSSASVSGNAGVAIGNSASAAIGSSASASDVAGVAIGSSASATTNSIAIGNSANSGAEGTIAIGSGASASVGETISIGKNVKSGYGSVSIGNYINENIDLHNAPSGHYSVAIGFEALKVNAGGYYNTAIGSHSMMSNTSGRRSVAIGYNSLKANTTGNNNTAIGYQACANVKGSNKTCIGYNSGPTEGHLLAAEANTDNVVILGSSDATVYIPGRLVVGNEAYIGNNLTHSQSLYLGMMHNDNPTIRMRKIFMRGTVGGSNNDNNLYGGTNVDAYSFSDRRLKYVGKENVDGLAKLRKIKVFNYTFKKDAKKTPRVGVIAQDLQKIFPNAVQKAADGFLTIRMEDMFYTIINAVKELDARVTALEKENRLLKEQNKAFETRLKALEAKAKI